VSGLLRISGFVSRRRFGLSALALVFAAALAGCAGQMPPAPGTPLGQAPEGALAGEPPAVPPAVPGEPGTGAVKVALILPLSAQGNAGMVAQSMRNSAELALAEFSNPNVQLIIKDDAGSPAAARQAAQQAIDEGAEIIIGSLFARTVQAIGAVARPRGIPVIAFSTDASIAARGVYLLSFLPESDVVRVLEYSFSTGKRSYVGLIPENAYGSVVEATFREEVARRGGRVVGLERYSSDKGKLQEAARAVAQAAKSADAVFIPDGPDVAPNVVLALKNAGVPVRQVVGTGLWDDQRVFQDAGMQGAIFAAPDPQGFTNFSQRYRAKYGSDPVRTATLSYDATALIAALVRTQGPQRFSEQVLTNPSGFAGIDGIFRFKPDGTNERGLAVMRVTPSGAQIASPTPRSFTGASGM
jgi:ABC-type branched-subunit amino acid transport system substrate-binding protein